ncbi:ABC transporter ATP-binding protein [Parachitinimonas caeni]|uniref:ABC transporter ATP-binding protein n=1 Tax=Parachitinimonas caeni TaxID=3031301 RepID=A0ABT7DT34_9NEIS|nr:ABC transporter ATP-binding protein [Parachitinimonas caeni]MDK2123225.1 ABC transporter ATP-binding protein [Parachitinimonas caeni]
MTCAIALEGLTKHYRDRKKQSTKALDNVTLSVNQGEAFGFIGPNGAGKSTTIKILTGIISPSSGKASMFGTDVSDHHARLGMGYVPENPYLYDYLTPLEVLKMGVSLHKLKVDNTEKHCMKWLERFSIAHVANKRIRSFSKGMTQRTVLAHALAIQPRLLILDEPLSGLDPIGRKEVVDVLMEYRHQGGTIFFSSHVLHDVERLADRFGLIHKGVLRTVQEPHELVGDTGKVLVRSMGTQAIEGMEKDVGERWSTNIERDQLWPLLEQLRAADHQIVEIKPALTLEGAFVKYVTEDIQPNRAS